MLVVRGLDENADEEMLRYEFSKHAPIKVRKFNWDRGFFIYLNLNGIKVRKIFYVLCRISV